MTDTLACPFGFTRDETGVAEVSISDPAFRANAYKLYAELRDEGPIAKLRFMTDRLTPGGSLPEEGAPRPESWVPTHFDVGVAALLDDRFTVNPAKLMTPEQRAEVASDPATPDVSRALRRNLLNMDAPEHTRLRRMVQPYFTGRAMAAMEGRVRIIADDLLDAAERAAAERGETGPNRSMELVRAFAYPLPVTVISEMVGIPVEDRPRAQHWTENLLQAAGGDAAVREDVGRRMQEFGEYL
ncbi:MAG: cytochrome P450 family protein, partial [Thermomicrobiales bacterium]